MIPLRPVLLVLIQAAMVRSELPAIPKNPPGASSTLVAGLVAVVKSRAAVEPAKPPGPGGVIQAAVSVDTLTPETASTVVVPLPSSMAQWATRDASEASGMQKLPASTSMLFVSVFLVIFFDCFGCLSTTAQQSRSAYATPQEPASPM
jgi:hypothetical protein